MISSSLMEGEYHRLMPDYEQYRMRKIELGDVREKSVIEMVLQ